jgi:hypothetical protein
MGGKESVRQFLPIGLQSTMYTYGIFLRARLKDKSWFGLIGEAAAVAPIFAHPTSPLIDTSVRKSCP